jgi:hypothetical protein
MNVDGFQDHVFLGADFGGDENASVPSTCTGLVVKLVQAGFWCWGREKGENETMN